MERREWRKGCWGDGIERYNRGKKVVKGAVQAGRRELKEYLGKGNEKAGEEEGWRKRGEGVMQWSGGCGSRK